MQLFETIHSLIKIIPACRLLFATLKYLVVPPEQ